LVLVAQNEGNETVDVVMGEPSKANEVFFRVSREIASCGS